MAVALNLRQVGANTATALVIIAVSAGTTWAVNKFSHQYFEITKNWKYTPSFIIREAAALAGCAVGCFLASRATPIILPRNMTFLHSHGLHLIAAVFPAALALNEIFTAAAGRNLAEAARLGCIACMIATPIAVGAYGPKGLVAAAGIGTFAGLIQRF